MKFQHILFEHAREQLDVLSVTIIKPNLQLKTLNCDQNHKNFIFWFNVTRIKSVSRLYNVKTFTFNEMTH